MENTENTEMTSRNFEEEDKQRDQRRGARQLGKTVQLASAFLLDLAPKAAEAAPIVCRSAAELQEAASAARLLLGDDPEEDRPAPLSGEGFRTLEEALTAICDTRLYRCLYDEGQRQLLLLALHRLREERPGFDSALKEIEAQLGGQIDFPSFTELPGESKGRQ